MTNWDDHVASLPDPTRDPKPPPAGQLSEEELKKIRAEKKTRSRRDWSGAAERIVARILESPRCFGVKALNKKDDRLQEVVGKDGKTRRFYANWQHPDYSFAILDKGVMKDGYCEVKSCSPGSPGINPHLKNTQGQIKFMNKLNDDYVKLWGLVYWEDVGKARVFIVPHKDWLEIIGVKLSEKAEDDARFKGKSLRRDKDFDLLEEYEIIKVNGRWTLGPNAR